MKASWTAVYGIIAKTMIGDNYPEPEASFCARAARCLQPEA